MGPQEALGATVTTGQLWLQLCLQPEHPLNVHGLSRDKPPLSSPLQLLVPKSTNKSTSHPCPHSALI